MENFHGRVLCLRRNSLVFTISSRHLSPKILISGLWSVTTVRSSQPIVKKRVCSSAHATAKASPSMGAYLCSAWWRNLEPQRVILQPDSQQLGSDCGHAQCF